MSQWADLHIHTTFSDSTLSPLDVVKDAYKNGVDCIGITDHDTVAGILPTINEAKKYNIEVVPAIELSSELNGRDIHVLGYYFDYHNAAFVNQLSSMQNTRVERMDKMIGKLHDLFGINNISLKEVCALAGTKSVGRPHLATKLIEKGWVSDIPTAFNKFIGERAPAYVPKFKQTPQEAVQFIHKAGGAAVLAHPVITQIDELIPQLVASGLDGLEVYYPNVSGNITRFYEGMAQKHDLVMTGGSDAHGTAKVYEYIGMVKVSYARVEELKKRAERYKKI
ncbi:MAG: PHP domain-containing protein [Candidatus Omnitrophica bacterium]|nr:PHP domain-containing protein [Candidatus Omnitrophota bacterium]